MMVSGGMDRLRGMAVFVTAVRLGSLMGAARHHGLSPSMAGKHVARLEQEVGARLLTRTSRTLALTEPGQAFYARCQRILQEYEAARDEAGDAEAAISGPLRLSAPLLYGTTRLRAVFARFMAAHPRVVLDVDLGDTYADLQQGDIDLAVRIGRLADSALIGRKLETCPMLLCGAPVLIGDDPARDTLEAAQAHLRLEFSEAVSVSDWTVQAASGETHRIAGPVRMRSNNMTVLLDAALAGLGIAYGPAFVFAPHIRNGELRPLLAAWHPPELLVQAVYAPGKRPSAKVRVLLDFLAQELRQDDRAKTSKSGLE